MDDRKLRNGEQPVANSEWGTEAPSPTACAEPASADNHVLSECRSRYFLIWALRWLELLFLHILIASWWSKALSLRTLLSHAHVPNKQELWDNKYFVLSHRFGGNWLCSNKSLIQRINCHHVLLCSYCGKANSYCREKKNTWISHLLPLQQK